MSISDEDDDTPQEESVVDDENRRLWAPTDDSSETGEPNAACIWSELCSRTQAIAVAGSGRMLRLHVTYSFSISP